MKIVSLYTGILGLDIAAHAAGFRTVAACDSEPFCRAVIRHYCPDIPVYESDAEVSRARLSADGITGPITAVIGGPPCQDASIAGRRAGQTGDRWRWPEYLRVVADLRPRWFVAKNPTGILSVNGRRAFGWLLTEMAEMGYVVGWSAYGANAVGAPHKRERVFIIGRLADSGQPGLSNRGTPGRPEPQRPQPADGCSVADSPRIGRAERRAESTGQQGRFSPSECGHDVADAYGEYVNGGGDSGPGRRFESSNRRRFEPTDYALHARHAATPPPFKQRMGSNLDGLPTGLAQYPLFPAGPQDPQEPWEPTRLTHSEPNRVSRLKALGNAVVPAQAYPVFAAIAAVEAQS